MSPKAKRPSNEPLLGAASSWVELLSQSQNVGSSGLDSSSEVSDTREAIHPKRSKRKQAKVPLAKKRRTTYDIRKQQKSDLVAEVAMLEKHLELLKHRVLLEQGEANTTIRHAEAANSVLHESIQGQRVAIAGAQGILVAHTVRTASFRRFNPKISNKNTIFVYLSSKTCRRCNFIRLGVDSLERRATQMAMKERNCEKLSGLSRRGVKISTPSRPYRRRTGSSRPKEDSPSFGSTTRHSLPRPSKPCTTRSCS